MCYGLFAALQLLFNNSQRCIHAFARDIGHETLTIRAE